MPTHKLIQEIQERNRLVAKTFLLNGKDWKEIKVGGEWKKWNGEKTTWKNFVLQYGDSVWTVDRAIDCYKFFCEEWGMTIEEVYGEEGISSKNLIAILGARMSKKETEELARMISRAFDDVVLLRLLPTRDELMGQAHIMKRLERIEKRLQIA